ncbi:MAG: hypothetical protein BGN87_14440 [Rhizobiales bacterium 65-79]|jgi:hypothetical protein|nr:hypothetical protein [Hyphomicrobiales bacterium]OJU05196.1 MAG: hypothetical protein BGN87_14440 [Rhizobiales bacterium 65-79]
MKRPSETAFFKPKLSQSEKRVDATTLAARAIVEEEASSRDAKTARLRAARLAQAPDEPAPEKAAAGKKKKTPRKSRATGG